MVTRVFVEKKKGFNIEAQQMLADLKGNLGIGGLQEVRILNRYDVSGLSKEQFDAAARTVLSEPPMDAVYGEDFRLPGEYRVFAMEYLPGQYDQRADSAAQCVQLLTQGERPAVLTAKVIGLKGQVSDGEFEKVKHYLINPVESREASMEKPESLELQAEVPADVARVTGFTQWDDGEMEKYFNSMGFAMTLSDLQFCRDYFRDQEHRDPTVTELRVIDTYWSDHCRHTTFLTRLNSIQVEEGPLREAVEKALADYFALREELYQGRDKPVSLMDMATIGGKYLRKKGLVPDLDESEEINACSIEAPVTIDGKTETWLIQFKNETHNHPTEIEPFGGAATCLGGAIRDPLSGRSYVYQAMRVTGSGDPTVPFEKTPPRQAALPEDHHRGGRRVLLLRQPDRPGHRPGHRAVRPRVRCQAPGDRRGGGGLPQGQRPPGSPCPRGCDCAAGRRHRPGRHRRGHGLQQGPHGEERGGLRGRGAEG